MRSGAIFVSRELMLSTAAPIACINLQITWDNYDKQIISIMVGIPSKGSLAGYWLFCPFFKSVSFHYPSVEWLISRPPLRISNGLALSNRINEYRNIGNTASIQPGRLSLELVTALLRHNLFNGKVFHLMHTLSTNTFSLHMFKAFHHLCKSERGGLLP